MIFIDSINRQKPPTYLEIKERLLENRKEEKKLAGDRGTLTYHFRNLDNFE